MVGSTVREGRLPKKILGMDGLKVEVNMVEKIDSMNMLTLKEEAMLSQDELDSYYNGLCQYVKDRKLTNTTRGATTIAPKLKRITNVVADKMTDVLAGGAVVKISDGQGNIPDGPVIFAHTHQGILDNFPGFRQHQGMQLYFILLL